MDSVRVKLRNGTSDAFVYGRCRRTEVFSVPSASSYFHPSRRQPSIRGVCHAKRQENAPFSLAAKSQESTDFEELLLHSQDSPPSTKPRIRCYGCGIGIQTVDRNQVGYIEEQKLQTKQTHKQYDQLLCNRCVRLTQGEMVAGVKDRRVKGNGKHQLKRLISPEDLRDQLKDVRNRKAVVVLLVDILDLPGSMLTSIRPLIGMNPIILIGTKIDLLPAMTNLEDVAEWLREYAVSKKLNVIDTHLVSNRKKKKGISKATRAVLKTRNGRDVYVMGLANVGKSAFVRAFLEEMRKFGSTNFTADALSMGRFLPVESSMPGTTLGIIKLKALKNKGAIYDTPGVHVFHRLTHLLGPAELLRLLPKRPLTPYIPPTPFEISKQISQAESLADVPKDVDRDTLIELIVRDPKQVSATYFWGGLVRIDIFEAPPTTRLVFYGPSVLIVHGFPLLRPSDFDPPSNDAVNEAVIQGEMMDDVVRTRYLSDLPSQSDEEEFSEEQEYDPYTDLSELLSSPKESETKDDVQQTFTNASVTSSEEETEEVDIQKAFFGGTTVLDDGCLTVAREIEIECLGFEEELVDISISGLPGWISVVLPRSKKGKDRGLLKGCIWAPRGVEAFLRRPIPVRRTSTQSSLPSF